MEKIEEQNCQKEILKAVEKLPLDDALQELTHAMNTLSKNLHTGYTCKVSLVPLVDFSAMYV